MNNPHHGARLTVHSREQIVARMMGGQKASEVAAAFAVSVRTVRKWLARFRAGGRSALSNHASAPARVARRPLRRARRGVDQKRGRGGGVDPARHAHGAARAAAQYDGA